MNIKPKTPDQVRQEFYRQGRTFSDWADENGYPRETVSRVLNGTNKALRGQGHEIALKLGLKVAA